MTIRYAECTTCQTTTEIYWDNLSWRCKSCKRMQSTPNHRIAHQDRDSMLPATGRAVKVSSTPRNKEQCGSTCLGGRITCDCQCRGKCHGAGQCRC